MMVLKTNDVSFVQERFQLSGTVPDTIWHIPITWTHSGSPNFQNLRPSFVFSNKTMIINKPAGHHWVIFNIQHSGKKIFNHQ